ncbi:MAG: sensor histidine kinase [bacterium]
MNKKKLDIIYRSNFISDFLRSINKFYIVINQNDVKIFNNFISSAFLPSNFDDIIVNEIKKIYNDIVKTNTEDFSFINKKIKINFYNKDIDFEFLVFKIGNEFYFILINDGFIRDEFFRNSILNTLSHELKTPLTIIKGYVQYLLKSKDSDNFYNSLDIVLSNVYRLEELITELIEVSKFISGNVLLKDDIFSLKKLIDFSISKFKSKINNKNIQLILEIDIEEDDEIIADFEKIRYAFLEILENAYKYGKDQIIIKVYKDNKGFYIQVKDNGVGIKKNIINDIFNLFNRTNNELNRNVYGLGVGLFLVKKIIDSHNGQITIKSKENKGTTVTIFIPFKLRKSSSKF